MLNRVDVVVAPVLIGAGALGAGGGIVMLPSPTREPLGEVVVKAGSWRELRLDPVFQVTFTDSGARLEPRLYSGIATSFNSFALATHTCSRSVTRSVRSVMRRVWPLMLASSFLIVSSFSGNCAAN